LHERKGEGWRGGVLGGLEVGGGGKTSFGGKRRKEYNICGGKVGEARTCRTKEGSFALKPCLWDGFEHSQTVEQHWVGFPYRWEKTEKLLMQLFLYEEERKLLNSQSKTGRGEVTLASNG